MCSKQLTKYAILIVINLFTFYTIMAQQSVTGIYELRGVMETASGFKLNGDSTFEFYFSYGALDRYGSGRWTKGGNNIIFNSKPWPGKDFRLVKSYHQPGNSITAVISSPNTMLLRYVYFTLYANGKTLQEVSDSKGLANFATQKLDSLALLFEFCPEKISVFKALPAGHNYFEFAFEPWIAEVFFKDFKLAVGDGQLTGKHPLLIDKEYVYEKEKSNN